MGDGLSPAWNKATIMRSMVLIGSLLACVSSVPFDAGYGIPAAPLIVSSPVHTVSQPLLHSIPAPAAPLPLQLLHSAPVLQQAPVPFHNAFPSPLVHSVPHPVVHSVPAPIQVAAAPAPLSFIPQHAPAPLSFAGAPLPFAAAPAPLPFASAPAPIPFAPAPLPIAAPPSNQFHAQDEFGQFSFGYENINSAKTETRDAFGVTRGSYQYVDANGLLQTVNYIADPVNGFRVAGTNIPVAPSVSDIALPVAPQVPVAEPLIAPVPVLETPEAPAAPLIVQSLPVPFVHNAPAPILNHFVHPAPLVHSVPAPVSVSAAAPLPALFPRDFAPVNQVFTPEQFAFAPAPAPLPFAQGPAPLAFAQGPAPLAFAQGPAPLAFAPAPAPAPFAFAPAPLPAAIPSTPSSQLHAQDEFGQFSFGYENINSAKTETRDAFGVTRGSYQYVDANGILQTVNYIAD